jgi:hypothetical protein
VTHLRDISPATNVSKEDTPCLKNFFIKKAQGQTLKILL